MKKLIVIIFTLVPLLVSAQRIEVYTYNSFKYISLFCYGLPREVVKTNSEMKVARMNEDGTGILKRHHTTKGIDERIGVKGYNANSKLTFAFLVSPYNVDIDGNHTSNSDNTLTWSEASGWDTSTDAAAGESYDLSTGVGIGESVLAPSPTGCAAYKGMNGTDKQGDWRLPTQREMQVMFTVIEQALGYIASGEVDSEIIQGDYWTSTEFYDAFAPTERKAWSLNTITGRPGYDNKLTGRMVRCVKDIYDPINE